MTDQNKPMRRPTRDSIDKPPVRSDYLKRSIDKPAVRPASQPPRQPYA